MSTLLFDMDCVLVNMLPTWLEKYNQATGESVKLEDIKDYDMRKFCQSEVLDEILVSPGFFEDMPPMPGAVPAVQELMDDGYDVVILTQPPRKAEFAVADKRRWIHQHFPNFDLSNVIYAHRKELVRGDLFIDDNPKHIKNWDKQNSGFICTVDWTYNEDVYVDFRIKCKEDWSGFVQFVRTNLPLR